MSSTSFPSEAETSLLCDGAGTSWHPQCPIRTICSLFSMEEKEEEEREWGVVGVCVKGRPGTSSLTGHPCHDMTWPPRGAASSEGEE
ncbi:unnamed protein product [Tetraodon nigroviridis]|uniref:(spotted green pufferfish) hypothetical protein n=1 Tax=Tetraodon nigroviridis TaxID=99883 RepID=Q4S2S5_TETNG|nr:unnamed protein product [Tetraodon nigroviridis]